MNEDSCIKKQKKEKLSNTPNVFLPVITLTSNFWEQIPEIRKYICLIPHKLKKQCIKNKNQEATTRLLSNKKSTPTTKSSSRKMNLKLEFT